MVEGTKAKLKGYEPNVNTQTNTWNMNEWYWES
jgi:peptide/nickel transport system substrate-binding protein